MIELDGRNRAVDVVERCREASSQRHELGAALVETHAHGIHLGVGTPILQQATK